MRGAGNLRENREGAWRSVKPLTACWSKGKNGEKHPYYFCLTLGCESYRKSIRREELKDAFDGLLQRLQPGKGLSALVKAMFQDAWNMKLAQVTIDGNAQEKEKAEIAKQIEALLQRIIETENTTDVKAYEAKIAKVERNRTVTQERLQKRAKPRYTFE